MLRMMMTMMRMMLRMMIRMRMILMVVFKIIKTLQLWRTGVVGQGVEDKPPVIFVVKLVIKYDSLNFHHHNFGLLSLTFSLLSQQPLSITRSLWGPFGPALGPSGLLDFVLRSLRALRPRYTQNWITFYGIDYLSLCWIPRLVVHSFLLLVTQSSHNSCRG